MSLNASSSPGRAPRFWKVLRDLWGSGVTSRHAFPLSVLAKCCESLGSRNSSVAKLNWRLSSSVLKVASLLALRATRYSLLMTAMARPQQPYSASSAARVGPSGRSVGFMDLDFWKSCIALRVFFPYWLSMPRGSNPRLNNRPCSPETSSSGSRNPSRSRNSPGSPSIRSRASRAWGEIEISTRPSASVRAAVSAPSTISLTGLFASGSRRIRSRSRSRAGTPLSTKLFSLVDAPSSRRSSVGRTSSTSPGMRMFVNLRLALRAALAGSSHTVWKKSPDFADRLRQQSPSWTFVAPITALHPVASAIDRFSCAPPRRLVDPREADPALAVRNVIDTRASARVSRSTHFASFGRHDQESLVGDADTILPEQLDLDPRALPHQQPGRGAAAFRHHDLRRGHIGRGIARGQGARREILAAGDVREDVRARLGLGNEGGSTAHG